MTALYTVGYEGLALDELLARLRHERIDRLIDIRALPLSRRRGFSKTPLAEALAGADIEYLHLRAAGNPFRKEEDALAKYAASLGDDVVGQVAEVVRGHRAALLCYEADPATCHRAIIAPRVARRLKLRSVGNI